MLVVDDEESIRSLVSIVLRGIADVDCVPNGREALRSVDRNAFDLILLDGHLPDMSGADVARAVRERTGMGAIPIVMVSGDPDRPPADSGITSFMRKPFDLEALRDCVRSYVGH